MPPLAELALMIVRLWQSWDVMASMDHEPKMGVWKHSPDGDLGAKPLKLNASCILHVQNAVNFPNY